MSDTIPQPSNTAPSMELLAPAGDSEAFAAALDAGANAVYLGLQQLNARRGARNFSADELPAIVAQAHARHVRVYLTLNIDIAQRELGQAVRILQLAQETGVDAVLVRDPAVIHLRRFFPRMEFHFSTQTCIANSQDVLEAGELGASRVVLARELSLSEIAACSRTGQSPEVETEVFVQGALCFCISGRCMLSSWAGGRSGNRGTCTSPCRVPWSADQHALGSPLSMKDLSAVHRLSDLQAAGVKSLKIEGRLKSARWVQQAVSLFAAGLHGADPKALFDKAQQLGSYAGRKLTSAYFDADHETLIAPSAGRSTSETSSSAPSSDDTSSSSSEIDNREAKPETPGYCLSIDVTDAGILCTCRIADRSTSWKLPKTVVHRRNKALSIHKVLTWLGTQSIQDFPMSTSYSNTPEFLMVPRAANALPDQISAALRQLLKPEDETLRLDLPDELRAVMARSARHIANTMALGDAPNRARLEARHVAEFVRKVKASGNTQAMPASIVVEFASAEQLDKVIASADGVPLIIALPSVFFEGDIPAIRQLVVRCVASHIPVEINSWGAIKIARESGARFEAGPGMGILNALAATMLAAHGCEAVTMSVEADRKQIEDVSASCPVPLTIGVFGRPALMITRVKLPRDQVQGRLLEDRRGIQLKARLEHGLWTLRPSDPFDLRSIHNNAICAAHLAADLVTSPSPAEEWLHRSTAAAKPLRFNYARTLA